MMNATEEALSTLEWLVFVRFTMVYDGKTSSFESHTKDISMVQLLSK